MSTAGISQPLLSWPCYRWSFSFSLAGWIFSPSSLSRQPVTQKASISTVWRSTLRAATGAVQWPNSTAKPGPTVCSTRTGFCTFFFTDNGFGPWAAAGGQYLAKGRGRAAKAEKSFQQEFGL